MGAATSCDCQLRGENAGMKTVAVLTVLSSVEQCHDVEGLPAPAPSETSELDFAVDPLCSGSPPEAEPAVQKITSKSSKLSKASRMSRTSFNDIEDVRQALLVHAARGDKAHS
mmetsp:Transcript_105426/g.293558  ORF Transcript_105426/g.293558 Transcript_105426/m.293558 type:complete len:113 (-) Transcript_105426:205-543(-)